MNVFICPNGNCFEVTVNIHPGKCLECGEETTVPLSRFLKIIQPFMDSVVKFFPHIETDVLKKLDEAEPNGPKKRSLKAVLNQPTYNSNGVQVGAPVKKDNILTVTRILGFRKFEPIKRFTPLYSPMGCMGGQTVIRDAEFETAPDGPPRRMMNFDKQYAEVSEQ